MALLSLACLTFAMRTAYRRVRPAQLSVAPWRPSRRQRRLLEELDRALGTAEPPLAGATGTPGWHRPGIERIAADLRRLNRQRRGVATRSVMWRKAILSAYDEQLRMASRCLGVVEYLDELSGVDRDIERLRVEGELQAAGLYLGALTGHPRRQP